MEKNTTELVASVKNGVLTSAKQQPSAPPASFGSLSHRNVIVRGMEPIITNLAYVIAFNSAIYNLAKFARIALASVSGARLTLPRFFLVKHFAVVNAQKNNIFALATGFVNSI